MDLLVQMVVPKVGSTVAPKVERRAGTMAAPKVEKKAVLKAERKVGLMASH